MADRTRFEHIKVNAACDDVVIYAGSHSATRTSDRPEERSAASTADSSQSSHPERTDGYRETTLQDISSSKMPAAQKAIIAIAVLAVVAFVIWYMFFR